MNRPPVRNFKSLPGPIRQRFLRSWLEGRIVSLEDRLAADDRRQDPDAGNLLGLRIEWATVENHEVGELPRLQRADVLLPVHGERGFGGVHGERVPRGQLLAWPQHAPAACPA